MPAFPEPRGLPLPDPDAVALAMRERAEALHQRRGEGLLQVSEPDQVNRLLHELQVHQIELEMQNDELRRVQEELEASRARYADLFHQAPVGYLAMDARGHILDMNHTAAKLLGGSWERWLGHSMTALVHPEDQDRYHLHRMALLESSGPVVTELRLEGGRSFWARLESQRIDLEGVLQERVVLSDITESMKQEGIRRAVEARLQEGQRLESLGRLAGGVAHDLNNVLGAILALTSAHVGQVPPSSRLAKALQTILHACTRGRDVVKSLLQFARHDVEDPHPLDLSALIRELAELLSHTTLKGVELQLELEPDLPWIHGDASALSHMLMNLCVNAVDAMGGKGTLTIRACLEQGGGVGVALVDTGSGMSPEVIQRALEPFFTTKPMGQGTGLGLAMAYGTMQAHEGELKLESAPGKGTTVHLCFPPSRCRVPESPPRQGVGSSSQDRLPHHILLVDDDELIRLSLSQGLSLFGHQVEVASSGEEAIRRLKTGGGVDLIILDVKMPGMSGLEALPLLLDLYPDQAVIMATGFSDENVERVLEGKPNVDCILKPFGICELQERVDRMALRKEGPTSL